MTTADPLASALLDLMMLLAPSEIKIIVGGGYGLVLKARHLQREGTRTRKGVPLVRATDDIDCFLSSEIIADGERTRIIREALDKLGYESIQKHHQFARSINIDGKSATIKFDFLAAQLDHDSRVRIKDFRTRPKSYPLLHAHVTPEAFPIEEFLTPTRFSDESDLIVYLPHPLAYLILKLFALHDGIHGMRGTNRKLATYHALDMYSIWAMITEDEWNQVAAIRLKYADHPLMLKARDLANTLFLSATSPGSLALRDQARLQRLSLSEADVESFRTDLAEMLKQVT